jgi:hypothetical protein
VVFSYDKGVITQAQEENRCFSKGVKEAWQDQ